MPHSKMRNKKVPHVLLILSIILIIPLLFFAIMLHERPKIDEPTQIAAASLPFTGDALLNAVNDRRKAYGYAPLKKNVWLCTVADIRLQDELRVGNGNYDLQKGYKKAVQEAKQAYTIASTSGNVDHFPDFKYQYTFYASSIEEGIKYFLQNTIYITLFTSRDLHYGCGAAKDKYGLIVTAS